MSSEPEFYTNSIPWAEELQRSYQDYMDGCESHIYDEESEFETLSTLPFCGCQTCYTREQLFFLVPRIIKAYKEGIIVLTEEETK